MTAKIRVAVLYGGRSAEHEVSIKSANNVIQYLDQNLFEVIPIGVDKKGYWFLGHETYAKSLAQDEVKKIGDNHAAWFTPEWVGKQVEQQTAIQKMNAPMFDVVFPVMHGPLCEDGTLQGLLELADLPYVGCGVLSSAIGMDKDIAKRLIKTAGFNVGPYQVVKAVQWQRHQADICEKIKNTLGFPVFVKPANTGSSVGITKVKTEAQLVEAINFAFRFDTKIIIEKALDVIELEIAVLEDLENIDPIISVVGEIKPTHEFYSYDAKYVDENGAELLIPAPIAEEVKQEARVIAKEVFLALECEGMARVDLFLEKSTKQIYFNEINTIPGFTQISMYPKLMEASGITYPQLLTHLVKLAMKRHSNKSQLSRTYAE